MIKFLAIQVKMKRISLNDIPEKYRDMVMECIMGR